MARAGRPAAGFFVSIYPRSGGGRRAPSKTSPDTIIAADFVGQKMPFVSRPAGSLSDTDAWNPLDPTPTDSEASGLFSTDGQLASGARLLYPTGSFVAPLRARPDSFADRFGQWGSAPLANAPATSDAPANFIDRFGNWASSPDRGQRSEIPEDVMPALVAADDDSAPVRILSRCFANLSSAPASGDTPPLAAAGPCLGYSAESRCRTIPCRRRSFSFQIVPRPTTMYGSSACSGCLTLYGVTRCSCRLPDPTPRRLDHQPARLF
jgi:hypothetical protein